jgi:YfiH family protein
VSQGLACAAASATFTGVIERTQVDGVVFYRSPLLRAAGVPHAFSTRVGGVSGGPFASLNLGNPNGFDVQDDVANIRANYDRLAAACGLGGRRRVFGHQVHGCGVLVARDGETYNHPGQPDPKVDALVSTDRDRYVAVRVADCVPVLLATDDGRRVAAVHAGWRGAVGGVVPEALKHFPAGARVLAAIGPHISGDAFEVGPEVADEFRSRFGADGGVVIVREGRKPHIHLQRCLILQLEAAGVSRERIDTTDRCSVRDADEFFSHRRDNGLTGRMAAIIGAV